MSCLVCKNETYEFINFGSMPIANNFTSDPIGKDQYTFEMKVAFCNFCYSVQLVEQPDREQMFHENYAFFSSTSLFMDNHFKQLSDSLKLNTDKSTSAINVMEIGCNDGILLKYFGDCNIALGIEPSSNVAKIAASKGLNVKNCFFDSECVAELNSQELSFDIVVSANVICHIPYINDIFSGVAAILKDQGIFVHEDPYLLEILEKGTFDQIYDEHVFLFSCLSQQKLAEKNGLYLYDVELISTHGGSARYFYCKPGKRQPSDRLLTQLAREKSYGLDNFDTYLRFKADVDEKKTKTIELIKSIKDSGESIVGYGATSKSTTILNYFGLDQNDISVIYDTTPTKIDKYTPVTNIPIRSYDLFKDEEAKYVVLFAWNHAKEIMSKEEDVFKHSGKKWLTILPEVRVI